MKKYPFKFLDAYGKEDTGIFFGRDEEINTLYEMVFQSSILLVYGASGTGKTSLIQCGLASKFPSHDWLALTIRRGNNINANFEKALADAGGKISTEQDNMDWLTEVMEETEVVSTPPLLTPLAQAFKAIYLNSFKPIYLIFDQFEELFILGSKEEEQQFIATVQEILQIEQPVKMIFSIREEYLGYLYDFEKAVPQLLRKKLRVEPMNLNKVLQVIEGATSYKNSIVRLKTDEAKLIAEGIFEKIKDKEKSLTIQLPYLQVFLDKLYLEITADETRQREAVFTAQALNAIGDIGDILQNFLEEQVAGISRKLSEGDTIIPPAIVWSILSPFATLEGTNEPIRKKGLYERLPGTNPTLIDAIVEAFINGRILRYTEDVDLYELAHDSLAQRIAEKRSDEEIAFLEIKRLIKAHSSLKANARELFSEKQLNFIEPFLGKLQLTTEEMALIDESREAVASHKEKEKQQLEKEKRDLLERQQLLEKNQNSQKRFIRWIIAALIIMIGIAVWAYSEKQHADNSKTAAIIAEYSTKIALAKAKASEKAAKEQTVLANQAKKAAIKSANLANIQKQEADNAKKDAINAEHLTKIALARDDKIISAFYFYNGNFALAQGSNKAYGFVNKNGDAVIDYIYDNAEQFDYSGFARVKKGINTRKHRRVADYLIDTSGKEYTVAYKLSDLNENVVALDLRNQNLNIFPVEIFKYPQLQIILLGGNIITELPPEIGQLITLQNLDLQGNYYIKSLPAEIGKLTALKALNVRKNQIEHVPAEIGRLKNLKILILAENWLHDLPPEIGQLKNLHIFDLSKNGILDNGLHALPPEVGQLTNLQNLDLSENQLKDLPAEIGQLINLENLNLHHNELVHFPAGVGQLTKLKNLDLSHNVLTHLSEAIGRLKKLQNLDLSQNKLDHWPTQIKLLKNLSTLDVSENVLKNLPAEIGQLTNLQHLKMVDDQLIALPAEIGRLKKLQFLNISFNEKVILPAEIGQLTNLQNLGMAYNDLKSLPVQIGQLKKLKVLDLHHNKLKDLSTEIGQLKNAQELILTDNPISKSALKKIKEQLPQCKITF